MSTAEWTEKFYAATIGLAKKVDAKAVTYTESADRLRALVRTGLLRHTDLHTNPERFFLAHRILAKHSSEVGPGYWVRFTVHMNLCAGTVLALGSAVQQKELDVWQKEGLLGCFALTEKLAGVASGLVVNTQADYDPASETFTLNSPDRGAWKNWISQGLVADKTVAIADLRILGKSFGPHAFLLNLREGATRQLVPGITCEDMGLKTIGNDLDNAALCFDKVKIPKSALLDKFATIDGDQYKQKVQGVPVFHMIGARLFTGRVAVAQAALEFRRGLFDRTNAYADAKLCWAPGPSGSRQLSSVPQLKALFEENERSIADLDRFVAKCEAQICAALTGGKLPGLPLIEAIAVAKVKAVEDSIAICHRLQQEVGSYALMVGSGFENIDFLTCCKFAEGDSRVLMTKMARDRLKVFERKQKHTDRSMWDSETSMCGELAACIASDTRTAGGDQQKAWDENWEDVYALAGCVMDSTREAFMAGAH
ncbi:acyl-CoA dehydrogenase/oxidase [Pavlovales sp. CCMP2436]|nr:acyl-CoA dehydrogenase/oxidase [Pavlovales sp. CCMP2436]